MEHFDKKNINIPNILSFYRILSFPFVLYFALSKQENTFVILLAINLVTDILDGFIARRFNMQTELGARMDSIADIGVYISAICLIFFGFSILNIVIFSMTISLASTIVELVSSKGLDNLTIPLSVIFLLILFV